MQKQNTITKESQTAFTAHLNREEKAAATIEKYGRDVQAFTAWLNGTDVTK